MQTWQALCTHTHIHAHIHTYAHIHQAVYRKSVESFLHDFSGACFCCASSASLQYIFAVNPATFHCLPSPFPAAFVQLRFYGFNMFTLILCICLVGVSVTYVVGAAGKTKGENAKKKNNAKCDPLSIGEVNNKNAMQPQRIQGTYLYDQ